MRDMMVETGHFALVLAFALALVQSVVPLAGARTGNERMMAVGGPVAVTGFALIALAFAALTAAYAQSDFSVANVWENSHSLKPLLLQDHRHLGQPRRLDAALGADPDLLRRAGRGCSAATCRRRCGPTCWPCRAGSARPSCCSSWRPPIRSRGCRRRRSRAATSTRSCRTSASPSIRRCSISAMSASRSASPLPSRR